jgi:hypothetical protein
MNSRMLSLTMPNRRTARVVVTCASLLLIGRLAFAQTCAAVPNPVAWWQGNGTAADVTGAHNGSLRGSATFAPGIVGQSFSFNFADRRR